jgi:hypothetical protein
MSRSLKLARLGLAVLLGAMLLGAPAAQAFPSQGGIETAKNTIPGPGTGGSETSPVPSSANEGTETIKPQQSGDKDYKQLQDILTSFPTTHARILVCIGFTLAVFHGLNRKRIVMPFTDENSVLPFLFLQMCVQMTLALDQGHQAADLASAANASCSRFGMSVGVKITRVNGMYVGQVSGTATPAKVPSSMSLACKANGNALTLKLKPRKNKRTLRQVFGPTLGVGFVNPTSKPVGLKAAFKVN